MPINTVFLCLLVNIVTIQLTLLPKKIENVNNITLMFSTI